MYGPFIESNLMYMGGFGGMPTLHKLLRMKSSQQDNSSGGGYPGQLASDLLFAVMCNILIAEMMNFLFFFENLF